MAGGAALGGGAGEAVTVRWVADDEPGWGCFAAGAAMGGAESIECAPVSGVTVGNARPATIASSTKAASTSSQAGCTRRLRDLIMPSI